MNLREQLAAKLAEARKAAEENRLEDAKRLRGEAETLKSSLDELKALDDLAAATSATPQRMAFPGMGSGVQPPAAGDAHEEAVTKAVNVIRFGAIDEPTDLVMREIYGGDYRQIAFDQRKSFTRYIRRGTADEILSRQVWGIESVKAMLQDGLTVNEIKSTMVEGQDILGGFAVPPQVSAQILARLPGSTAVRGGGALVVQTTSNMIQWLKITGGDGRYVSALRGVWGAETASPSEKNMTFGLLQIPVDLYTYKVPMSVSLIEDASNIVDVFVQQVAPTLAIDEDEGFLIGDGANKPRGILPGSLNAHSLTEVNSGSASALTWAGVRALRHGIGGQYRQNTSFVGNGDTAGVIEAFVDGAGRPYVEFLDPGQPFLRGTWRESEAMPDIAGSAFPLIFGNMSGYAIVERLGLSVQRYNDSNTGINKVEFHVRRRIGGAVIEPWKFALQKVATA